MAPTPEGGSLYRQKEAEFGSDEGAFYLWLEKHRYDDRTTCVGWAVKRAERFYGYSQQDIAARTGVYDSRGREINPPHTKSYLSSILSGRTRVDPPSYVRWAKALGVSPVHFYIAEGWCSPADVAAFQVPERDLVQPILTKLGQLPDEEQPAARAVLLAVLDTLAAAVLRVKERAETKWAAPPRVKNGRG